MNNEHYFSNRQEWRKWLEKNSKTINGIWMIIYKKHTKKECVAYTEAVEEALCFGWIDGQIKRINDDYYIQRYTPRRPGSRWSKYNIDRVKKLTDEGKMTASGLNAYKEVLAKPDLAYDNRASGEPEIPADLFASLETSKTALDNFRNFPLSARRIYIGWLNNARKAETRPGRIKKIFEAAKQNKKPGMTI